MAFDLKRLDPDLDGERMGVIGDDDDGRFLIAQCDASASAARGCAFCPAA